METMSRVSKYSRLLQSIAFTMLVAGLTVGQASAGTNRPAAVPADFVITPFGYYHPTCVNHLAQGDVLHTDQKAIQRASGALEPIPVCPYPHFKADGIRVDGDEPAGQDPPTISHAWI